MIVVDNLTKRYGNKTAVDGKRYSAHRAPLRNVGVLLEARAVHPGRSADDQPRFGQLGSRVAAIQVNGWTTPPGVTCSSRQASTTVNPSRSRSRSLAS